MRGDAPTVHWQDLADLHDGLLLDVRNVDEFAAGHVEGAVNIPLPQLRDRLHELKPDQEIWAYCQVGQRGYYATRILRLQGFNAYNLSGGFKTYQAIAQTSNLIYSPHEDSRSHSSRHRTNRESPS